MTTTVWLSSIVCFFLIFHLWSRQSIVLAKLVEYLWHTRKNKERCENVGGRGFRGVLKKVMSCLGREGENAGIVVRKKQLDNQRDEGNHEGLRKGKIFVFEKCGKPKSAHEKKKKKREENSEKMYLHANQRPYLFQYQSRNRITMAPHLQKMHTYTTLTYRIPSLTFSLLLLLFFL